MKVYKCEACGKVLFTVNDDGLIVQDNGLVRNIDGVCECGHGFHYSLADCYLKRLLVHYNQVKLEV